jgi:hypothetical protein
MGVLERVTFAIANPETAYTIARIAPVNGEGEAISVRIWPGWAVTSASPTTAPPLLPKTNAGAPPSTTAAGARRHPGGCYCRYRGS